VSKILTITLVKIILVQTGSSNLKRRLNVSSQPSHVTITTSGSATKRQTRSPVIYSGDIFVRNVYRKAMYGEAVCIIGFKLVNFNCLDVINLDRNSHMDDGLDKGSIMNCGCTDNF
jgi:hypothetical protein